MSVKAEYVRIIEGKYKGASGYTLQYNWRRKMLRVCLYLPNNSGQVTTYVPDDYVEYILPN